MATKDNPEAKVYISDEATKGLSPRKYLGPEIEGGARRVKRAERSLIARGIMGAGQRIVPGKGMTLDRYGNIPGPRMVQILSRLSAFGEQGFRANASEATKKRMSRAKRAVRATGTDTFVGYSKRGGEPLAVYQLVSRGHVVPVLAFTNKEPAYTPRFDFHGLVAKSAHANWPAEMARAATSLFRTAKSGR